MKKVVAIHFTNKCNYNCSFCYRMKGEKTIDRDLLLGIPKYLKEITEQVAIGGGEPLLFPELLRDFATECKRYGLICNVTTNGSKITNWSEEKINEILKDITMVSLSFDSEKINTFEKFFQYQSNVKKLKKCGIQVGANLLVEKQLFKNLGLLKIVDMLFKVGVDRVFALCPKNFKCGNLLNFERWYKYLTIKYKHFYIDDLTKKIIEEKSYFNWKKPCHFGKDIVSISENGEVSGCSFDEKGVFKVKKSEDILQIKDYKFEKRYYCPYLQI